MTINHFIKLVSLRKWHFNLIDNIYQEYVKYCKIAIEVTNTVCSKEANPMSALTAKNSFHESTFYKFIKKKYKISEVLSVWQKRPLQWLSNDILEEIVEKINGYKIKYEHLKKHSECYDIKYLLNKD
jgi:hypothetical protein